jgi:hypothetical protein
MENIAHSAQPDHEQAKLGLGVQTLIFSQRRLFVEVSVSAPERLKIER